MSFIKFKSFKSKFTALAIGGFALTIFIAATYATLSFQENARNVAIQNTRLFAKEYSQNTKLLVDEACYLSSYTALNMINMVQNSGKNIDIKQIFRALENTASENDNLSSVFLILQNDMFEEKNLDAFFESVDTTGYFVPFIEKTSEGGVMIKQVDNYTDVLRKEIYNKAFKERRQITTDLEVVRHKGEDLYVLPVITPIFSANRFYGVAVVHLILKDINNNLNRAIPFDGNAKIMIVDNNKTIVAVCKKKWLSGRQISSYSGIESELYKQIDFRGSNLKSDTYTGASNLFEIGKTEIEWETLVFAAYSDINIAHSKQISRTVFIASLIMLVGLIVLITLLRNTFRPVEKLLVDAKKISQGTPILLKENSENSEIAELNNAFRK